MVDHDCLTRALRVHAAKQRKHGIGHEIVRVFGIVYAVNWLCYMVLAHH